MALALFAGALAASTISPAWGYQPNFPKSDASFTGPQIPTCVSSSPYEMHEREKRVSELFAEYNRSFFGKWFWGWFSSAEPDISLLQFEKNSTRKTLLLSAQYDRNGALDPLHILPLLSNMTLHGQDVKYSVVTHPQEICKKINESYPDPVDNVWLFGHGNEQGITISDPDGRDGWIHRDSKFLPDCFNNVAPNGRIHLISQDTAMDVNGRPYTSIAQKIANIGGREVVGAEGMVCSNTLQAIRENGLPVEPYHPGYVPSSNKPNVFKLVLPRSWEGVEPWETGEPTDIHYRYNQLRQVLNARFEDSSLQEPDNKYEYINGYFAFSKRDGRHRFLILSAAHDHVDKSERPNSQGGLHPLYSEELLVSIAKAYDIKFKVVGTRNEVVEEIKKAVAFGDLLNIVFMAHGSQYGIRLGDDKKDPNSYMATWMDWTYMRKALKGHNLEKISLIACETAGEIPLDHGKNFAKKMSEELDVPVVASAEYVFPSLIKITSMIPFNIEQPSEKNPKENVFKEYRKGATR